MFTDAPIIHLRETDSTNNYAANLQKQSKQPEGTVILADLQTAGKGQRGTTWESHRGENLLCSLVLYPDWISPELSFTLNKCLALATAESISEWSGLQASIKWPNDIVLRGKKVAGMLVELSWSGERIQQAIAGIGVNLNQRTFSVSHAGSVSALSGRYTAPQEAAAILRSHIFDWYGRLRDGQWRGIDQAYRQSLYRLGVASRFIYREQEIMAMITGVDVSGRLKLYAENGDSLTCEPKEIAMVW
jgi:BirA family biotin operon repressor/biotin-[acetyl-CoA-carboxylase] ligase